MHLSQQLKANNAQLYYALLDFIDRNPEIVQHVCSTQATGLSQMDSNQIARLLLIMVEHALETN